MVYNSFVFQNIILTFFLTILLPQVFGVTDERLGEVVGAALILRPGKSITADEVKTFCQGKVSAFKIFFLLLSIFYTQNIICNATIFKNLCSCHMEKTYFS